MKHINEDIKSGNFKPVYLLYGEERYLIRQYRDRLKDALCVSGDTMNTHFYEGKDLDVDEIIDLAQTLPFFAPRRVIFIDNSGLFRQGGDKMAKYILGDMCETTYLIFTESSPVTDRRGKAEVDRRSRLFKAVQEKGYAAEFAVQDDATLKKWIVNTLKREGKSFESGNTLDLFLSMTGTNMDIIHLELEKLICYCIDRKVVTEKDVESVCIQKVSDRIFAMMDAIAERKPQRALDMYHDLIALKESPMGILYRIAGYCNNMMEIKSMKGRGYDNNTIQKQMNLREFQVRKYVSQAGRFRMGDLKNALDKCVKAEEDIKSGRLEGQLCVEMLILSVL